MYIPSVKSTVYTDGIFPSVIPSVYSDGNIPSVYTDRFGDGIMSVGNHYRRNISVGNSVAFLRFSGSVIRDIDGDELFGGQKYYAVSSLGAGGGVSLGNIIHSSSPRP
jgi:hypothetical protein